MSAGGLWFSSDSAIAWACHELLKGREISHATEIEEVGAWRLSAIVYVLRHRYRWPILSERRGPARIAYYRLGQTQNGEPVELPKSAIEKGATAAKPGTHSEQQKRGNQ